MLILQNILCKYLMNDPLVHGGDKCCCDVMISGICSILILEQVLIRNLSGIICFGITVQ